MENSDQLILVLCSVIVVAVGFSYIEFLNFRVSLLRNVMQGDHTYQVLLVAQAQLL